ncbi:MAG: flagellar basal body rod protein FlgB [bacterium]
MISFINFLKTGLDGSARRQRALANNIANVNTPDYKRKDVNFVSTLKKESSNLSRSNKLSLETTDDGHIKHPAGTSSFKNINILNTSSRNDGNNVDAEHEMAEIAKNNIYYNTMAQQASDRFSMINNVITKGGQ